MQRNDDLILIQKFATLHGKILYLFYTHTYALFIFKEFSFQGQN